jgi:hypothetical protein
MAYMAPPNQPTPDPNHPPKRETNPLSVPMVGLGKDQVKNFLLRYDSFKCVTVKYVLFFSMM